LTGKKNACSFAYNRGVPIDRSISLNNLYLPRSSPKRPDRLCAPNCLSWALSTRSRRPGRISEHSAPWSAEVKN